MYISDIKEFNILHDTSNGFLFTTLLQKRFYGSVVSKLIISKERPTCKLQASRDIQAWLYIIYKLMTNLDGALKCLDSMIVDYKRLYIVFNWFGLDKWVFHKHHILWTMEYLNTLIGTHVDYLVTSHTPSLLSHWINTN